MDRAYLTGAYPDQLRNECLRDYESLGEGDPEGALSERRAWGTAGVCMPFQLAAVCEEAVREKTGNMEGLAAVGPNADAFAPPAATEFVLVKQILPSKFPVFSLTDSNARSMEFEMAHTSPPREPGPPFT